MDFAALPQAMFIVGNQNNSGGISAECCVDSDGRNGMYVWTDRTLALAFAKKQGRTNIVIDMDRDFHVWKWIEDVSLPYCVVDRQPIDHILDLEPVPSKYLPLDEIIFLAGHPAQLQAIKNVLRRQGSPEEHIALIHEVGTMFPQLKPSELLKKAIEMTQEHAQRQIETDELLSQLTPQDRNAFEKLVPSGPCSNCGEAEWFLVETSASGRAAKWRCEFCGKQTLVKESDQVLLTTPRRDSISKEVQREVWQRDQGKCVICGSNEKLEFDHIIPVSRGGSSTARNIQLLCEPCNRRKGSMVG